MEAPLSLFNSLLHTYVSSLPTEYFSDAVKYHTVGSSSADQHCGLPILKGITRTHLYILFFGNSRYVNEFWNQLSVELRDYYYQEFLYDETNRSHHSHDSDASFRSFSESYRTVAWSNTGQRARWISTNPNITVPLMHPHRPIFRGTPNISSSSPRRHVYGTFFHPLFYAIIVNNLSYVHRYFKNGNGNNRTLPTTDKVNTLYPLPSFSFPPRNGGQFTLLHFAVLMNRYEMVRVLLSLGADPDTKGTMKAHESTYIVTPVGLAILRQHYDLVYLLLTRYKGKIGNCVTVVPSSRQVVMNGTMATVTRTPFSSARSYRTFTDSLNTDDDSTILSAKSWDILFMYLLSNDSAYSCEPSLGFPRTDSDSDPGILSRYFYGDEFFRCLSNTCTGNCVHTQTPFHHRNLFHRYPIISAVHTSTPSTPRNRNGRESSKFRELYTTFDRCGIVLPTITLPYARYLHHRNRLVQLVLDRVLYREHAPIEKVLTVPFIERLCNSGEDESLITSIMESWLETSSNETNIILYPQAMLVRKSILTNILHSYAIRMNKLLRYHEQLLRLVQLRTVVPGVAPSSSMSLRNHDISIRPFTSPLTQHDYRQLMMYITHRLFHHSLLRDHPVLHRLGNLSIHPPGSASEVQTKLDILRVIVTLLHDELDDSTVTGIGSNGNGTSSHTGQSSRYSYRSNVYSASGETELFPLSRPQLNLHPNDQSFLAYFVSMLVEYVNILRIGSLLIHCGADLFPFRGPIDGSVGPSFSRSSPSTTTNSTSTSTSSSSSSSLSSSSAPFSIVPSSRTLLTTVRRMHSTPTPSKLTIPPVDAAAFRNDILLVLNNSISRFFCAAAGIDRNYLQVSVLRNYLLNRIYSYHKDKRLRQRSLSKLTSSLPSSSMTLSTRSVTSTTTTVAAAAAADDVDDDLDYDFASRSSYRTTYTVLLSLLPSVREIPLSAAIFRYWVGVRAWKRRQRILLKYEE